MLLIASMIGNNGNGIASSGAIDKGVFNITYIINIILNFS